MFYQYDSFINRLEFWAYYSLVEATYGRSVLHMIQILGRVQELSSARQMRSRLSDAHPP